MVDIWEAKMTVGLPGAKGNRIAANMSQLYISCLLVMPLSRMDIFKIGEFCDHDC
jgi:hypothetical protein